MAAGNTATEAATTLAAAPACQRKSSENADWMGRFQEFFQTPMEEHKACLKVTVQKMVDEWKEKTATWRSKENGTPAPVETSPKN